MMWNWGSSYLHMALSEAQQVIERPGPIDIMCLTDR